ncbi:MAG: DUF4249 domain-containing protein, partial [Bacteroidota bacterium]
SVSVPRLIYGFNFRAIQEKVKGYFANRGTPWALAVFLFLLLGCVEEFVPKTRTFESALVIEATITNELKLQEILLSRTFRFESNVPNPESGAAVRILDDAGNEYAFGETDTGRYVSRTEFTAQPNRKYTLEVTTTDGREYASEPTQLTQASTIEDLYAERITNDDGVEGMAIFVDSFDPTNSSQFYRYEYEEAYRIIAPDWRSVDLAPAPDTEDFDPCDVVIVGGDPDAEVCYWSATSNTIIITETESLDSDRVVRFPVRFIDRDNYIISHRYSILVRQFVQTSQAYTFFSTLQDFSGTESLFSDTQTGFFNGNVFSKENENEKVLGYFDVASVTERRLFFNYDDFFPGEELPPYAVPCEPIAPPLVDASGRCRLRFFVASNGVRYLRENDSPVPFIEGPYFVVPRACGDCTVLGSTEVPDFWVE